MHTHFKIMGWFLFLTLVLVGCGQAPAEVSVGTPQENTLEDTPTVNLPAPQVDLTPTSLPTQLPTQTPAPSPTETSAPVNAITHFDTGQEVTITSINMLDEQNGWAHGSLSNGSEHLLRTTDGGNTWQDVNPPQSSPEGTATLWLASYPLDTDLAWAFFSHSEGIAPEQAVVWHTQDGGLTWQTGQPLLMEGIDNQFSVSDIQFLDPQNGWLLAHVGVGMNHDYVMLYRTQDGGTSWQRLIDPYMDGGIQACYKPGMQLVDGQQGWLSVNCNGVMPGAILYHTQDGGSTWESITLPAPTADPTLFENPAAACGVDDLVFFTPSSGKFTLTCANYETDPLTYLYYLYTTQDGGLTWTATAYPGGHLTFLNDQIGWTQNQDIFQTKDGGANWIKTAMVSWEGEFDFVSEKLGWSVARSGDDIALVKSEDGGVYWTMIEPVIE